MKLLSIIQMMFNALVKPKQRIPIPDIPDGRILDIGGGGEGMIAQIGGPRIIAVDKFMSEIREAREKALDAQWLVADGTALPFANDCLDNATALFSCMYMAEDVKGNVFHETRRILKEGGEFWIWDVNMAPKSKVFAIRLQADVPGNRSINTVYGVKAKDQSAGSICGQLQEAGFETTVISDHKHWYFIKAKNRVS